MSAVCGKSADMETSFSSVTKRKKTDFLGNQSSRPSPFRTKKILRKLARLSFHMIKPFARPIFWHLRDYFTCELRKEIQQIHPTQRLAVNCGENEILIQSNVGFLLCSTSEPSLVSWLISGGEELGIRRLIQHFLKPNDVFIDVGANLGMHTIGAARAMEGRGKIFAFEPFDPIKRLLEKNVWINGYSHMTDIHQAAVSSTSGHQKLFRGPTNGMNSLFPLDTPAWIESEPVTVPVVRLDDIVSSDQKIDLIKIDVEGAELDVVKGTESLIINNPNVALIVEFGPSHLKRTGYTTKQWFQAFAKLGLIHRAIHAETGQLEVWSWEQLEKAVIVNLFFSRPESSAWARAKI